MTESKPTDEQVVHAFLAANLLLPIAEVWASPDARAAFRWIGAFGDACLLELRARGRLPGFHDMCN
jgi:hypothetical protein